MSTPAHWKNLTLEEVKHIKQLLICFSQNYDYSRDRLKINIDLFSRSSLHNTVIWPQITFTRLPKPTW